MSDFSFWIVPQSNGLFLLPWGVKVNASNHCLNFHRFDFECLLLSPTREHPIIQIQFGNIYRFSGTFTDARFLIEFVLSKVFASSPIALRQHSLVNVIVETETPDFSPRRRF